MLNIKSTTKVIYVVIIIFSIFPLTNAQEELPLILEKKEIRSKTKPLASWNTFVSILNTNKKSQDQYLDKKSNNEPTLYQQKTWTKIIVEKDKFSYAMPSNFLVYKKPRFQDNKK